VWSAECSALLLTAQCRQEGSILTTHKPYSVLASLYSLPAAALQHQLKTRNLLGAASLSKAVLCNSAQYHTHHPSIPDPQPSPVHANLRQQAQKVMFSLHVEFDLLTCLLCMLCHQTTQWKSYFASCRISADTTLCCYADNLLIT
jgi:hypothetical protein